jgi:two-component system, sensor histidine kinase and response regulator
MKKTVILCVDDEPIILDSLLQELDSEFGNEYLIEIADSSEDALELVEELLDEHYDLPVVISDYIMPNMKGDELLKRIHQISPATLNVLLTGQAEMSGVINVINSANLYRYIAKPWNKADLILTIREAIKSYFKDQ